MAAQLRGDASSPSLGQSLKDALPTTLPATSETAPEKLVLKNRAGESKSPYVRAHAGNAVSWQLWGDEALEMAKRENRLLFLSLGYSACHCKSMVIFDWVGIFENTELIFDLYRVSCHGARVVRK